MSVERFTLDTNILVYSVDGRAGLRHRLARQIIDRAIRCDCRLTLQAVSEFYAAATRKGHMPAEDAAAQSNDWLDMFGSIIPTRDAVRAALAAASSGRVSYWDALLLASAAEGGCTAILTEDLSDGGVVEGIRIVNPFGAEALSPEAQRLLSP
jgi:predicted nucleic acid-binding protein